MNIIHIQTGLPPSGNVPYKLHEGFLANRIKSKFLVFESKIIDMNVEEIPRQRRRFHAVIYNKYHLYIKRKIKAGEYLYSNPITFGIDVSKNRLIREADCIFIHWAIGGFLSFKSICKLLETGKPIICFLHDMWPITGGCHHSFECINYTTGCYNCGMFKQTTNNTASSQMKIKIKMKEKFKNLYFLAPSSWMYKCAIDSLATHDENVFLVPHLYDKRVFYKKDRNTCRSKLGLPVDKIIIGFGALDAISNPFKGWAYLQKAIDVLSETFIRSEILLVIFGPSGDNEYRDLPFEFCIFNRITDQNKLADIYNCFNVFVTPSLAESFGMTALEAIACGSPVTCFDVGGLKDVVQHLINGYRAKYKDSNDLAYGIKFCIQHLNNVVADEKFSEANVVDKHVKILRSIVQSN